MKKLNIEAELIKHIPDLQGQAIQLKRVSGLTNITWAVWVNQVPRFIFKEFSEGCSHDFEYSVCIKLSRDGLIPEVIFANKQYRIDEFVQNSRHPKQQEIVEGPILESIMSKMHEIHKVEAPYTQEEHQTLAESVFNDKTFHDIVELKKKNSMNLNYNLLLSKLLVILEKRQKWAKYLLPQTKESVKVCHNDLNNLNILLTSSEVYLIDYDYAGYNYIAYDIANLINETSFDYSLPTYPGFTIIKTYSEEELEKISKQYPKYSAELKDQVVKFMCVSNLYWAVWSLQRNELNVSEIFGILEHGLKRLQLFEIYQNIVEKKWGKFSDIQ